MGVDILFLQRLPSDQPVAMHSWNLLGAEMFRQFSLASFLKMSVFLVIIATEKFIQLSYFVFHNKTFTT